MKKIVVIIFAAALGSGFTLALSHWVDSRPVVKIEHIDGNSSPIVKASYKTGGVYPDFTGVSEKALPAVVHIRVKISQVGGEESDWQSYGLPKNFHFFFDNPQQRPRQGGMVSGSGVIINANGYIVTNNHIVENSDEVEVVLWDNRKLLGEVVGTDPDTDLAVIKVKETNLPYLAFVNSDLAKVGEWVLAVGNPFNLNSTVTAGIVSAKARDINIINRTDQDNKNTAIESFIQTDAAINSGNSGGALVNMEGGLLGINTAIASPTGVYSGYGFAIPANLVSKVVEDIIAYGIVQRGWLGVQVGDITDELVKNKDLKVKEGVYVDALSENGAAKQSGIKEEDVIVKIDDQPMKTKSTLIGYIGSKRPGDKVKIFVNRKGKEYSYDVVLKNKDGNTGKVTVEKTESLGVLWEEVPKAELKKMDIPHGVRVKSLGNGKLRKYTDMHEGFVVTNIDNRPVSSVKEVNEILSNKKSGEQIILGGKYPFSQREYLFALRM